MSSSPLYEHFIIFSYVFFFLNSGRLSFFALKYWLLCLPKNLYPLEEIVIDGALPERLLLGESLSLRLVRASYEFVDNIAE
jgi:hypothetical protein